MRRNLSPRLNCLTDFLILTLIVSFIFQSVLKLFAVDLPLLRSFGLSFESLKSGFIWTLFTYSFLHEGALHLLFNILGIHFISRNLEYSLTRESFIMLFLFSIFLGSISWLSFNINGGFLIGTSAFVMGSLTRFCLMRPDNPITFLLFFVLPISLKPKHLLFGVMGLELYGFIFSELKNISTIAHSAHLGGMLAGFILSTSFGKSFVLPKLYMYPHKYSTLLPGFSQRCVFQIHTVPSHPTYQLIFLTYMLNFVSLLMRYPLEINSCSSHVSVRMC